MTKQYIKVQTISDAMKKNEMVCQAEMMEIVHGRPYCGAPADYVITTNYTTRGQTRGFVCAEHVGNVVEWWQRETEEQEKSGTQILSEMLPKVGR